LSLGLLDGLDRYSCYRPLRHNDLVSAKKVFNKLSCLCTGILHGKCVNYCMFHQSSILNFYALKKCLDVFVD
jgi:hypothetical protein